VKKGTRILLAACLAMVLLTSVGMQAVVMAQSTGTPGGNIEPEPSEDDKLHDGEPADSGVQEPPGPYEGGDLETPCEPDEPVEAGEPGEPEVPEEPGGPEQPEQPEVPVDPQVPDEPADPEDPADPGEPGDHTQPGQPGGPEVPEVPDPKEPEEPADLEVPEEPGDPGEPEEPEEPQVPGESDASDDQVVGEPPTGQIPPEPGLDVTITTGRSVYQAGDTVRLTVTLRNTGYVDLTDVRVEVPLANLDVLIPLVATGQEEVIQASFRIPYNFHMGYIGVGAYAECQYGDISVGSSDAALVVVDEEVTNQDFKECGLPPLPADWQSVVPLDVIPSLDEDTVAELREEQLSQAAGHRIKGASPGPFSLSEYPDTIEVSKDAEWIQGCRFYEVTLGITGSVPKVPLDVILVIDRSGSMGSGTNSSMHYAKEAAKQFARQVLEANPDNRVAVVSFAFEGKLDWWFIIPRLIGDLYTDTTIDIGFSNNVAQVNAAIDALVADGGTNTEAGFIRARNLMQADGRDGANKVIVFLTDGVPTVSIGREYGPNEPQQHNNHTRAAYEAGQSCHDLGYQVYTVALLKDVPQRSRAVARDTMQRAQNAGYYETFEAPDLSEIYDEIVHEIMYSAKNAVVTDQIPLDKFEFVRFQGEPSQGQAEYDESTGLITWNVGDVTTGATLSYVIRAKADFEGGTDIPTNDWAKLDYIDVNGNPQTKDFPVPTVDVPPPLTVDAGEDRTIPYGDGTTLGGNPTATGGTGPYTYLWTCDTEPGWSANVPNPSVYPDTTTRYTVTVTDQYGCSKSDDVLVTVLTGSITVTKHVEAGDKHKKFTIYVEGEDGKLWSMRLAHGESATIHGLKANGYRCTIREVVPMDYRLEGIEPSSVVITADTLAYKVTVTNRKVNDSWFRDWDEQENTFHLDFWEAPRSGDKQTVDGFAPDAVLPKAPQVVLDPGPGDEPGDEGESHDDE